VRGLDTTASDSSTSRATSASTWKARRGRYRGSTSTTTAGRIRPSWTRGLQHDRW